MITTNSLLKLSCGDLRARAASGTSVRLFSNDYTPTPADTLASFAESGFGGYARVALAPLLGAVFKVMDGLYEFDSANANFLATALPLSVVFGFFVADSHDVLFAQRFSAPVLVSVTTMIQVTMQIQLASQ